jgi:hypothetical protein
VFAGRARSILASVDLAVDEAKGIAEGGVGTETVGFETGTTFMGSMLSLSPSGARVRDAAISGDAG